MLEHFEIKSDSATLDRYATDASIFRIIPKGVFAPKSKEELHAFVRRCIEEKSSGQNQDLGITARAAGTCMSGGSLTDGYVIDFSAHLNKLVHFSPEKRQITVEPGMYYRDMEKITLEKGLILPSYPASRELCAVGGMVGNNAAGEKTFKYGKTDKYVESLEMICEDGNVYTFQKLSSSELQNVLENDTTYYGELHRHVLRN
jgi:FAD/FMN-containing dehydrogenase